MKCFRRYLCVLLCLALLFSICCVPVSAVEVDVKPYNIYVASSMVVKDNSTLWLGDLSFNPHDGNIQTRAFSSKVIVNNHLNYANTSIPLLVIDTSYYIGIDEETSIVPAGESVTFTLENVFDTYGFSLNGNSRIQGSNVAKVTATIYYMDGSVSYHDANYTHIDGSSNGYNFSVTMKPQKDVKKICFSSSRQIILEGYKEFIAYDGTNYYINFTRSLGETRVDTDYFLRVDQDTKEVGLLSGILDSLTSGLANVFQAIIDLPAKIWEFIENGLKALFVPDEDYIAGYKDKWEQLLADRLGAVYQVVQITFGAWEDIGTADERNSVSVPNVTIPLPDDCSFSFGGYDVQIVPDGFLGIVETLKLIVGIACTFFFVNGLRKRYDEVMGVEK